MAKNFTHTGAEEILAGSFVEISIDPLLLSNFSNEDGISEYLHQNNEEFSALRVELLKELIYIIDTYLTAKQKEVIKMIFLEGKTQNQASSELCRSQSTVHKILAGNIDYSKGKKRYGGALKKIRKLCAKSESIKEILKKMREMCDG